MKVLIVEDDGIISLYLKECIEALGHEVIATLHHSDDVENFSRFLDIDLLLMDINIYGPKDGIILAQNIYEKYRLRCVFITSYKDSETVKNAMFANPLWYITKPLKEHDIETMLIIAQKHLRHGLPEPKKALQIGPYTYQIEKKLFFENEKLIKLGDIEAGILLMLIEKANTIVSVNTILTSFWPDETDSLKKLRDSIYRIRRKMPKITIESYQKVGYLLKRQG
jgi:DNA-binding response OmpR family regulator